jgi:predicted Zn-dependent peptidase
MAISVTRLANGIRVVTEQMEGVSSVAVGCWVGTGSRDETPAEAGISHFLEHLLFKGTPGRTARDIAEAIDAVGGDMNAYTAKEYTSFYVRTLARHSDLALDVLAEILQDPALRDEDVEAERQVILEEVLMHLDEPADVAYEHALESLFPGHGLGREILGDPEVIKAVAVPDIRTFFERHYRPGNVVISAAGNVEHGEVVAGLERRFAGWEGGAPPERSAPETPPLSIDVISRDTEQAHLAVSMRAPRRRSADRFALTLMNHALGGGVSSRLFQQIREERGLAYSVSSEWSGYSDAGALVISVGTAPEHAAEVLDLVRAELARMAQTGLSDREVEVAKGHVNADTLLALEDSGSRMSRLGAGLLLHDEVLPIEEVLARVEAVTESEIARLAASVLSSERTLAVVGPFGLDDLDPL